MYESPHTSYEMVNRPKMDDHGNWRVVAICICGNYESPSGTTSQVDRWWNQHAEQMDANAQRADP
jgi:hypothetical protein